MFGCFQLELILPSIITFEILILEFDFTHKLFFNSFMYPNTNGCTFNSLLFRINQLFFKEELINLKLINLISILIIAKSAY